MRGRVGIEVGRAGEQRIEVQMLILQRVDHLVPQRRDRSCRIDAVDEVERLGARIVVAADLIVEHAASERREVERVGDEPEPSVDRLARGELGARVGRRERGGHEVADVGTAAPLDARRGEKAEPDRLFDLGRKGRGLLDRRAWGGSARAREHAYAHEGQERAREVRACQAGTRGTANRRDDDQQRWGRRVRCCSARR